MTVNCEERSCAHNENGYCRAKRVEMGEGCEGVGCHGYTDEGVVPKGAGLTAEVACPLADCRNWESGGCACGALSVGARSAGEGDIPPCREYGKRESLR